MSFTKEELELLHNSYEELRKGVALHPRAFYDALFEHAPQMRSMFREDIEGQNMKFMTTLGVILTKLQDEDAVDERFQELGTKHAELGVQVGHFQPMEDALIDTLKNELGAGFTAEHDALWRRAFLTISERMIRRGNIPEQ
ncbi:globin [Sedimentitalea sp. CY04]|uniref:Globin n=2 Tax=Parasedimentitalea denitrificans TaxID=2211118 RepID=A0ABX0W421_9RHOB|nr:globin [Sedimentitalea sp. CY04]